MRQGEGQLSGNIGGQVRALPFTGFTALPFIVVGLVLSSAGFVMRLFARDSSS